MIVSSVLAAQGALPVEKKLLIALKCSNALLGRAGCRRFTGRGAAEFRVRETLSRIIRYVGHAMHTNATMSAKAITGNTYVTGAIQRMKRITDEEDAGRSLRKDESSTSMR